MSTTATQTSTSTSFPVKTSASGAPASVDAELNFFKETTDGEAPYNYVEPQPEGVPRNNIVPETVTVAIHDMRGHESSFNIDKQAFLPLEASYLTRNSKADFSSDESTRETYYPEVERLLLKSLPGTPSRVFIFDHTIRKAIPGAKREPVMRTHVDQTTASARERVRFHLPEEADELLAKRVRLVNVWRPLNGPVESSPLAVADSSTVASDQLLGVQHRYPNRTGETAAVKHSGEKWWYWSGMNNNERLLLQCFDSETGGRTPHSAFKLPGEGEEGWRGKQRESIEVRALVFG